jgi:hypothetical protein
MSSKQQESNQKSASAHVHKEIIENQLMDILTRLQADTIFVTDGKSWDEDTKVFLADGLTVKDLDILKDSSHQEHEKKFKTLIDVLVGELAESQGDKEGHGYIAKNSLKREIFLEMPTHRAFIQKNIADFKPAAVDIAPSASAIAISGHSGSEPAISNDGCYGTRQNQEVLLGTSLYKTGDDNENGREVSLWKGMTAHKPEKMHDDGARAHMSKNSSSCDNVEKGNDDPGSEKEDMKKRVLDYIPKEVQEQYREVCFGQFNGKFFPGIQLGPFDVPFGGDVQDNYVKMAKKVSCSAQLF